MNDVIKEILCSRCRTLDGVTTFDGAGAPESRIGAQGGEEFACLSSSSGASARCSQVD